MSEQPPTAAVGTAPAPPIVGGRPEEVADGVFVVPDGRVPLVPNIGVIVGERAALVVDTGMGPRNGALVREIARGLAGGRPLLLTLTHFHPEHGYGAQAFGDATIVYNREQRGELRDKAAGYLQTFRDLGAELARELEDVEFVDPHIVYDGGVDLDLGGKEVQLRAWGAAHSRGDQAIFLPAEGVLFTGDLVENRFFPIFPYFPPFDTHFDGGRWIRALDELIAPDFEVVVPGHGEVTDTAQIREVREYLEYVRTEARRLRAGAVPLDDAVSRIDEHARARWSTWDTPRWIGFAARAFYGEA